MASYVLRTTQCVREYVFGYEKKKDTETGFTMQKGIQLYTTNHITNTKHVYTYVFAFHNNGFKGIN